MLLCEKCGHTNAWDTVSVPQDTILDTEPATVASHRALLAEVDAEIAQFKAFTTRCISALEQRKKNVERQLHAVVYPILSLPTEITVRIFVECLPDNGRRRLSRKHAPLLLTRVCRRWRDLAILISELWNVLHIRCLNIEAPSDAILVRRGLLPGLTPWLSRAQPRPLFLTVYRNRKFSKGREIYDDVSGAEQLNIAHILARVAHLDIGLSFDETLSLTSWNTPFPRLEYLRASLPDSVLADVLRNAPLLTELRWSRNSRSSFDFQWFASSTLTTLNITGEVPATQFVEILQNFPALSDLACIVDMQSFRPQPPLTFPNLRSLSLDSYRSRYMNENPAFPISLLDLLTLPHLDRLHCTLSLFSQVLTQFLSRSACIIRELSCEFLENAPFDIDSDMWQVLSLFPSIEILDIRLETEICYLLDGIDPEAKEYRRAPHLFSQLQHLTITYGGFVAVRTAINYSNIIDILRCRREHATTAELRSLHIMIAESTEWDWYPGDTLAAEFDRLISAGLDFTIGVHGEVMWP
ncbi:hypothetical protein C8R45DRAFT_883213 [Mycena sanguinolenta]|nr:hypothetical protein C8R45DRAFT_883213 [Mycena sanguinolenta]